MDWQWKVHSYALAPARQSHRSTELTSRALSAASQAPPGKASGRMKNALQPPHEPNVVHSLASVSTVLALWMAHGQGCVILKVTSVAHRPPDRFMFSRRRRNEASKESSRRAVFAPVVPPTGLEN